MTATTDLWATVRAIGDLLESEARGAIVIHAYTWARIADALLGASAIARAQMAYRPTRTHQPPNPDTMDDDDPDDVPPDVHPWDR